MTSELKAKITKIKSLYEGQRIELQFEISKGSREWLAWIELDRTGIGPAPRDDAYDWYVGEVFPIVSKGNGRRLRKSKIREEIEKRVRAEALKMAEWWLTAAEDCDDRFLKLRAKTAAERWEAIKEDRWLEEAAYLFEIYQETGSVRYLAEACHQLGQCNALAEGPSAEKPRGSDRWIWLKNCTAYVMTSVYDDDDDDE